MKKLILVAVACAGLAACGADGEPVQPAASVGVSVTPDGVNPSAAVGVRKGPFSISWGLF